IVPDDKLSLAIGKKGQNVRLASQLSGWKIDIHSESKVRELEHQAKRQMASLERMGEDLAETLFKLGWRSPSDLAEAAPGELSADSPEPEVDDEPPAPPPAPPASPPGKPANEIDAGWDLK